MVSPLGGTGVRRRRNATSAYVTRPGAACRRTVREAVRWFCRAARAGDKTAQHNLGVYYATLEAAEQATAAARSRRACQRDRLVRSGPSPVLAPQTEDLATGALDCHAPGSSVIRWCFVPIRPGALGQICFGLENPARGRRRPGDDDGIAACQAGLQKRLNAGCKRKISYGGVSGSELPGNHRGFCPKL